MVVVIYELGFSTIALDGSPAPRFQASACETLEETLIKVAELSARDEPHFFPTKNIHLYSLGEEIPYILSEEDIPVIKRGLVARVAKEQ